MDDKIACKNEIIFYEERFKKLMCDKIILSNKDWMRLKNSFTFRTARKNTILHQNNSFEFCARLIVKGSLKVTHHETETYVFDFRSKDDFLCDINSLLNNKRSCFSFETITYCEWIETDIYHLIKNNDKISQAVSLLVLDYLNKGHERASFLRIGNADDRYKAFCNTNPQIIKYAKQCDIASYLDITTQSLSRIRKNLLKPNN